MCMGYYSESTFGFCLLNYKFGFLDESGTGDLMREIYHWFSFYFPYHFGIKFIGVS